LVETAELYEKSKEKLIEAEVECQRLCKKTEALSLEA